MPEITPGKGLEEFEDSVRRNEPLSAHTRLRVGGPADLFAQPKSVEELAALVRHCFQSKLPFHILGNGCNVLVRDEGVRGLVVLLRQQAFTSITVAGQRVRAGAGAPLVALISESARLGLAGLEPLVGIGGTVGGAVRCNVGDRTGDIGQFVRRFELMDSTGQVEIREREEIRSGADGNKFDEPVLLAVEFELERDNVDNIVKRLRKAWIQRNASHPLGYVAAARLFRNPRAQSAAALIVHAGLASAKVGGAELSDRNANYVVARPGVTARDILRLIELARSKVRERSGIELELALTVW